MRYLTVLAMATLLVGFFFQCAGPSAPEAPPMEAPTEVLDTSAEEPTAPPPEPTATPIPLPTDTPTPSIDALEIESGHSYISYDYLHVLGQVTNNTDEWYEYVKIVGSFYDANDVMLGTDFTYIEVDQLAPRDVALFDLSTDAGGSAALVTSYKLQVQGRPTTDIPYREFEATVTNQYESYGYYHLVGEVKNTGTLDCEYVKIVAGFYDAAGNVVGVDFTYTELDLVPAGARSPFDLSAGDLPAFDRIEIWVQGRPI